MLRNHEIIERIRYSKAAKFLGVLAASTVLLAGCGVKAEQATTPISKLDVAALSTNDAKQFVKVNTAINTFSENQKYLETQMHDGPNDLYSNYVDPLRNQTYGSGWEQSLAGVVGLSAGDQEQVTEINSRDAVEEVIRARALEIAVKEGKPQDAANIVDKYIDSQGNTTKEAVLREIAELVKQAH